MAQQTAVEYLIGYMSKNQYFIGNDLLEAFEQAKQMEKEQIMTANIEGTEHGYKERTVFGLDARPYSKKRAEQYYNETYGENKD